MIAIQRRAVVDEYRQFSFNRNSVAFGSNGRLYYPHQARFESVGGWTGVLVEEGTTNLLPSSKAEAEANPDVTTNVIWSIDTTRKRTGSGSLRLEWNGTGSWAQAEYRLNVTPGQTYTFTTYAYVESPGYKAEIALQEVAAPYRQIGSGLVDLIPGQWNRLSVTWDVPSDIQLPLRCILRTPRNASGQYVTGVPIWWDSLQVEQKPYATSWANGTRAAETLTVPTAGVLDPQEGTIELFWAPIVPPSGIVNQGTSPPILQVGRYAQNNSFVLWAFYTSSQVSSEPRLVLYVKGSSDSGWSLNQTVRPTGSGWYAPYQRRYFAVRWQNGNTFWVAVDGVVYGPWMINDPLTAIADDIMYLGGQGFSGIPFGNGIYFPLRISRRARTDQEIADAYTAGTLTADAETTLLLPMTGPDAQRGARVLYVPAVGF